MSELIGVTINEKREAEIGQQNQTLVIEIEDNEVCLRHEVSCESEWGYCFDARIYLDRTETEKLMQFLQQNLDRLTC